MDLKAYQDQIIDLIPLHNSPDFKELLDSILFGESNSIKFLIKMELNRRTKPCQRIIDLRDKVIEPCELFEKNNIEHYLTKAAVKVLEDNIALYGLYSVGVFEAVHDYINAQKEQKQKQITKKIFNAPESIKKDQCECLALAQKNKRGAPRMFYVSDVLVTTAEGESYPAKTVNVSNNGLKIKLKDEIYLRNDALLSITFTGLAREYHDNILKEAVTYRLVKQEPYIDNVSYFYLNAYDKNTAFSKFFSDFIRINQYKYKLDVHYYYQIAKIQALKYSYLAQMSPLPIYLDTNATSPFLFALENNENKQITNDWCCGGVDQLTFLFTEGRLANLISEVNKNRSTTIYTFSHEAQGKHYFLSASEEELLSKGLKQLFLHCGRSKPTWRTYHLTLTTLAYRPTPSQNIIDVSPALFNQVTHLATLQQLSVDYPMTESEVLNTHEVGKLNQFLHCSELAHNHPPASVFSLFSPERRKEERYQYASTVSISEKRRNFTGQIIDFSYSGLRIKLDQLSIFSNNDIITVNLTELQKISKQHTLTHLQYKVVNTNANNILHLQVNDQETFDICQSFFSLLIRSNAKRFTCLPLKAKKQPQQKYLVEMAEESFINTLFFVSKENNLPTISYAAIDIDNHPLHTLFTLYSENSHELNYYPLTNNHVYERLVVEPIKNKVAKEAIIYVKAIKNRQQEWQINSYLDEDFTSEEAKISFIKVAQKGEHFFALHYQLRLIPEVNTAFIQSEIGVISRFAMHLTKKLEEELAMIEGVIEITDHTSAIINTVNAQKSIKVTTQQTLAII